MSNPLLNFTELPFFQSIEASHVMPALTEVLSNSREKVKVLEDIKNPNWHNFANAMEDIDEAVGRVWSPVNHLNSVLDSKDLREAYQSGIALLTEYHTELGQNQALYRQYKTLKAAPEFDDLDAAQKKIISNSLIDFKLSGAELSQGKQDRLRELSKELSELSNQFEKNVLDATQSWQKLITHKDELSGLPSSAVSMAEQMAKDAKLEGYLFTLQIPQYIAVMQHSDNSALRKEMYTAYSGRASEHSDEGKFDNTANIIQILRYRAEKAALLGYADYAEYSLVKKMAKSSLHVENFLLDLVKFAKPVAEKELQELQQFAADQGHSGDLQAWDISYYSEMLREQRYAFNDEQVKPYFPADQALNGMFEVARRLFDIRLAVNHDMETWHDDVMCFDVFSLDNELIGRLYADLYVRKHKRGGAWMDSCIHRRIKDGEIQKPVAFLTCNFSPPVGDEPALLNHSEVETLFHEFGHTLHHLLTEVNEMSVAGINGVAWDAVELPSQFLENWCWHQESLSLIARHYKTEEVIPQDLLEKMRAAKNFQSGMQCLRQVEFALFDMRLHSKFDAKTDDVQTLLNQVRREVAVMTPPPSNKFQNGFGHIFSGGYAAGYYSYKWSEVLSADAFGRFEEEGIFNEQTGSDFKRSILQRGGVDDPNTLFEEFRGRSPKIEPLLQQTGIL